MYRYERLDVGNPACWTSIPISGERTIFQTPAWVAFLSDTQEAEPVLLAVKFGERIVGYFIGLIWKRYGIRILGSPCPGWSTDYMGFALSPGECRKSAIQGLLRYAFDEMDCAHVELMDRCATTYDIAGLNFQSRLYQTFLVDLTQNEQILFNNLTSACRRCIRKAENNGVMIEVAEPRGFAEDYYGQLRDVFAKQRLVPTYGLHRVRRLISHLHPTGHLLLLRARDKEGRSIATAIFPHFNGTLHFWGGASWREYQILRPNEALHWYAMMHAKAHGLNGYDMGGGGEYKRKYGGSEVRIPWIRKSKYVWVASARDMAQRAYRVRQEWAGRLLRLIQANGAKSCLKA